MPICNGVFQTDPCPEEQERDQLRVIGQADSGLTIWEDAFGGTFALLPGSNAPTLLPAGYANLVRSQIEAQNAQGVGTISPSTAAQIAENARQFDAAFAQGADEFNRTDQRLTQQFGEQLGLSQEELAEAGRQFDTRTAEGARQFDISTGIGVDQFNALREQEAQQINEANRLRVAETNAGLRVQQATLMEQIRQADLDDARDRENMRFAIRKEELATEQNNQRALRDAVDLRSTIQTRISNTELQRQNAITQVNSINAQIENNVQLLNAQEQARVEQLNEERRQANLAAISQQASEIGRLAQNPADIGRLAAQLRSGGAGALSEAVAGGQNFITDESLTPLAAGLGVQRELLEGPTLATPNLIEGSFVEGPEFSTPLGVAPEIADLFQQLQFDPSGIARGESPAAGDLSQPFQPIAAPGDIQAQTIGQPQLGGVAQAALPAPTGGTQAALPAPATGLPGPAITTTGGEFGATPVADTREFGPNAQQLFEGFRASSPDVGINVGQSVTPEMLEAFFAGFRGGGVAPPGNPVVVGDGTGETRELAMTDFFGNLHVVPFDQLPQAQDGGIFDARQGLRTFTEQEALAERQRQSGGIVSSDQGLREGAAAQPQREPTFGIQPPQPRSITEMLALNARGGAPIAGLGATEGPLIDFGQGEFGPQPSDIEAQEARRRAISGGAFPTTSIPGMVSATGGPVFPADPQEAQFRERLESIAQARGPVPENPALLSPTPQPAAPAPQPQAPAVNPISPFPIADARQFQQNVFRDALQRFGITDPTRISPIAVSAPGTSRFLQQGTASVFGAGGFGPESVFFEELARLTPQGVTPGIARRTA